MVTEKNNNKKIQNSDQKLKRLLVDVFLSAAFFLIIAFTGGLNSPFFLVLFFIIIGVALRVGRDETIIIGFAMCVFISMIYYFQVSSGEISFWSFLIRVSLIAACVPFALFFQEKYKDLEEKEMHEKKLSKILETNMKQLQRIRQKEKDMLDIMGHELRTPLSVIKFSVGMIEMKLQRGEIKSLKDKPFIENWEKIKESLDREIKLIESMLEATKIEAKKIKLYRVKVDLIDVINDAIDSQKKKIEEKGLELDFETGKEKIWVFADREKMQQIVDNLLSNAVKYTEEGKIRINCSKDNDFAKVSITDTGKGIPKDEIKKLGSKFYRIEQYTTKDDDMRLVRPGGAGLGLYVVFGLIGSMGGKVEVESEVGKGSTFSFTIPLYKGQKEESIDEEFEEKDVFKRMGLKKNI